MSPLAAGATLGRYKILRLLGMGAMGEVYLAEDPQIERRLAIKTVRVEEVGKPVEIEERKKRLLREARAAGRLIHPNIVMLFDAGEDQGVLFLAFEFVEGMDLSDRLAQPPALTLGEALRVIRQAAEGLEVAHRQGIVHRDIKPSNLLIGAGGMLKITDFGIAKMVGQSTELTMQGSVVGSPHYLSPEQIRGEELDGRSDIFSLGVVLYEMLSKQRPFAGETLTTLVYQILHQEPTGLEAKRPDLPPRLMQLVRRMLAKDRAQRFATAGEVAQEVAALERELPAALLGMPAAPDPDGAFDATHRMPTGEAPPPGLGPPPAMPGAAPPPVMPGAPLPPGAAAAPASSGRGSRLVIAIVVAVLALGLLTVALVAPPLLRRLRGATTGPTTAQTQPALPTSTAGAPTGTEPSTSPSTNPLRPTPSTAVPTSEPEPPKPTIIERPGVTQTAPVSPPPATPRPTSPTPAPARPTPHATVPVPAAPEPAPEEEAAPAASAPTVAADREMKTGMDLSFQVEPEDAIVKIDGRVIGRAVEWNAKKRDGRSYSLPDEGDHTIVIKKEGLRDYVVRAHASAGAPLTTILVNLRSPASARAGAPAGDRAATGSVQRIRVSQGLTFKVTPENAAVLVDGQPAGKAADFRASFGGRRALELSPGSHRVSLVADGYARVDFDVEVAPGAPDKRKTVEAKLVRDR